MPLGYALGALCNAQRGAEHLLEALVIYLVRRQMPVVAQENVEAREIEVAVHRKCRNGLSRFTIFIAEIGKMQML
jgi:hypothetical protein